VIERDFTDLKRVCVLAEIIGKIICRCLLYLCIFLETLEASISHK